MLLTIDSMARPVGHAGDRAQQCATEGRREMEWDDSAVQRRRPRTKEQTLRVLRRVHDPSSCASAIDADAPSNEMLGAHCELVRSSSGRSEPVRRTATLGRGDEDAYVVVLAAIPHQEQIIGSFGGHGAPVASE